MMNEPDIEAFCRKVIEDWEAPAGIPKRYDFYGLQYILRGITTDTVGLKDALVARGLITRPDVAGLYSLGPAGMRMKAVAPICHEEKKMPSSEANWKEFRSLVAYYRDCVDLEGKKQYYMKPEKYGRDYCIPRHMDFGWLRFITDRPKEIILDFSHDEIMMKSALITQNPNNRICIGYPLLITANDDRTPEYFVPLSVIPVKYNADPKDLRAKASNSVSVTLDFQNASLNLEWIKRCVPYEYHEELFCMLDTFSVNGVFDVRASLPTILSYAKYDAKDIDPNSLVQNRVEAVPGKAKKKLLNTAVLFRASTTPYVQNLMRELNALLTIPASELDKTALAYIYRDPVLKDAPRKETVPVRFALTNAEQDEAIAAAMNHKAVRVQGPPGTGKSQMSVNLIANCIYRGESVLFTSKNHAALEAIYEKSKGFFDTKEPIVKFCITDQGMKRDFWYTCEWNDYLQAFPEIDYMKIGLAGKVDAKLELASALNSIFNEEEKKAAPYLDAECELATLETDYIASVALISDSIDSFDVGGIEELVKLLKRYEAKGFLGFIERIFQGRSIRSSMERLLDEKYPNLRIIYDSDSEKFKSIVSDIIDKHSAYHSALKKLKVLYEKYQKTKRDDMAELEDRYFSALDYISNNSSDALNVKMHELSDGLTETERENIDILCQKVGQDSSLAKKCFDDEEDIREYGLGLSSFHKAMPAWCTSLLSLPLASPMLPAVFDQLIVDEASQVDCVSIIPALYRAKRVAFVGDDKQFRPVITLTEQAHSIIREKYFDSNSRLMQFNYRGNSAYDILRNGKLFPHIMLKEHFRCQEDIADFFSSCFYNGELRVRTGERNNSRFPDCLTDRHAIQWVDVKGGEDAEVRTSADKFAEIRDSGFEGTIGIITPLHRVVEKMKTEILGRGYTEDDVKISTAYGFQGGECDVIIFDISFNDDLKGREKWYVDSVENKNIYNVTISRAKACLICVGDRTKCREEASLIYLKRLAEGTKKNSLRKMFDSEWERILYNSLLKRGIVTETQYHELGYDLDMAYIDEYIHLDIEVDGRAFHFNIDGTRCYHDIHRNYILEKAGWVVERFLPAELRDDMEGCLNRIEAQIKGARIRASRT